MKNGQTALLIIATILIAIAALGAAFFYGVQTNMDVKNYQMRNDCMSTKNVYSWYEKGGRETLDCLMRYPELKNVYQDIQRDVKGIQPAIIQPTTP